VSLTFVSSETCLCLSHNISLITNLLSVLSRFSLIGTVSHKFPRDNHHLSFCLSHIAGQSH